jgi:hypothetical protein
MDKKLFKEAMKQAWYYILAYFTNYLMPILKETFEKTKTYFINLLWDSVKEEFTCRVKSTVEFIETFFESPDYKEKEKAVIDTLFKNVNLPLPLKPFKPLLKKILRGKLHKLIEKYLKKLDAKF